MKRPVDLNKDMAAEAAELWNERAQTQRERRGQHSDHIMEQRNQLRDAKFREVMLRQAIERKDMALVSKLKYNFKHGDLVQMTRLGISRQNASGRNPKDESSSGVFVRVRHYAYHEPKRPAAIVRWLHGGVDRESETRIDYLEPLGTPR